MHVLGSIHEHQRADRNTFITVNWPNVPRLIAYNFYMLIFSYQIGKGEYLDCSELEHPPDDDYEEDYDVVIVGDSEFPYGKPITAIDLYEKCTYGGYSVRDFEIGYDYKSIMHYPKNA